MKKIILKVLKYFAFTVVALLITVNLFIVLSGRFYLYKGVANTYLVGKTGPTIYDLDVFYYSTVDAPDEMSVIPEHSNYNQVEITKEDRKFVEDLGTKALLVYKGDSLMYEEYWGDHTKETVSNSFSVAKTLVALLISIAVEDGKIKSLDESVSNYIPEFKEGGKEVITIRHLLSMSSGLDWEESAKNPLSDNAESYYGGDLYGHVTRQKLERSPGKLFKYQSGNSQLLGFIIEKATGKDLSEYAEEKIWKKIGAEHDAYWSLDKELGDEKAFCCMYATARDYGRLGQLILNKGKYNGEQIFPLWYYHEMVSPSGLNTEDGINNSRYGLHIWTYMDEAGQVNYCRGIKGQYIIAIPEEDLLIIRLGSERLDQFKLPEDKKNDEKFIAENKKKIGHSYGLFRYIALGKKIKEKTEKK
jgi:CubicO group peptidase (beta-lactamase class C family)